MHAVSCQHGTPLYVFVRRPEYCIDPIDQTLIYRVGFNGLNRSTLSDNLRYVLLHPGTDIRITIQFYKKIQILSGRNNALEIRTRSRNGHLQQMRVFKRQARKFGVKPYIGDGFRYRANYLLPLSAHSSLLWI